MCSPRSTGRLSPGEGLKKKTTRGLPPLPAATPLFTVQSTVDADFGKHFPKARKPKDDQISPGKTILPGEQLYILCGGATNKETGKGSPVSLHGMPLRMTQHKLEEKPIYCIVLYNDGECYHFHGDQTLVTLPPGAQAVDGVPIPLEASAGECHSSGYGTSSGAAETDGEQATPQKKTKCWSKRRKLKLGSALSPLVNLPKTSSQQQTFHRDRRCWTPYLGYQSTICWVFATTLELRQGFPKRLRDCTPFCIAHAGVRCKWDHCSRQLPQECVLNLWTWGAFWMEAEKGCFLLNLCIGLLGSRCKCIATVPNVTQTFSRKTTLWRY